MTGDLRKGFWRYAGFRCLKCLKSILEYPPSLAETLIAELRVESSLFVQLVHESLLFRILPRSFIRTSCFD